MDGFCSMSCFHFTQSDGGTSISWISDSNLCTQIRLANAFDAISSPGPMKDYKVNVASVMWKLKNWAIRWPVWWSRTGRSDSFVGLGVVWILDLHRMILPITSYAAYIPDNILGGCPGLLHWALPCTSQWHVTRWKVEALLLVKRPGGPRWKGLKPWGVRWRQWCKVIFQNLLMIWPKLSRSPTLGCFHCFQTSPSIPQDLWLSAHMFWCRQLFQRIQSLEQERTTLLSQQVEAAGRLRQGEIGSVDKKDCRFLVGSELWLTNCEVCQVQLKVQLVQFIFFVFPFVFTEM